MPRASALRGGRRCERRRPRDSQARGLALVRDLAGLDGALLAAHVDDEAAVPVDLDPDSTLAVDGDPPAAEEVARAEAVVDAVEASARARRRSSPRAARGSPREALRARA